MSARIRVCVTGATGYLASELVAQLLGRGYAVHATVRNLNDSARLACLHDLPGASKETLTLYQADLLDDGAFDACVRDSRYVFHTASPFITSNITDTQTQLIKPALEGTRNVFRSIAKSVSAGSAPPMRVVVTSSAAAIFGKATDKETCFDEDDWNFSSTEEGSPPGDGLDMYRYSKLVAEREAWALSKQQSLALSTICPTFIMGPARTPRTDGESLKNMRQALEGEMPHRGDTAMVDVRDVALAHVLAAETPAAANKRFLTSSAKAVTRAHVLRVLQAKFPQYQFADEGEPADVSTLRHLFCSKHLESTLGLKLRPMDDSLVDMAEAMLRFEVATPKLKAKSEL